MMSVCPKALVYSYSLTFPIITCFVLALTSGKERSHNLLVPVFDVEEPILPRVIEGTLLTAERGGPPPPSPVQATIAQQTTCTQGTGRQGKTQQERG